MELCLFNRSNSRIIQLILNKSIISSLPQINVLGVIFDSKLQWQPQLSNLIKKAKRSLSALNLIKPYFTNDEIQQIVTSYFNSVLYYNSEIWHIPTINHYSKQQILSASLLALKLCTVNVRNLNVRISVNAENRMIDRSVIYRSDFGRSVLFFSFER